MGVNLLAISVGNSRAQLGAFLDERLVEHRSVAHGAAEQVADALRALYEPLAEAESVAVYLASVNDPAAERIGQQVRQVLGDLMPAPVRVGDDVAVPIGRQLDPEAMVGVDRLLCAAAAYDRIKQACIVADAGTALTVDFVDGEGTFQGGAILPGIRMMLDALQRDAQQLPRIEFARPEEAIGHSTQQAMRGGVFHGLRGAVRELTERYAEFYGAYPKVIATGGDAPILFEGYELVEAIVPELPLLGMAVAHRYAVHPPAE